MAERLELPPDGLPPMCDDIPRLLGYGAVAAITPRRHNSGALVTDEDGQIVSVQRSTISSYWLEDLQQGRWLYVPKPAAILVRGPNMPSLPAWTEDSIREWLLVRPGVGNRTRGAARRGSITPRSRVSETVDAQEDSLDVVDA